MSDQPRNKMVRFDFPPGATAKEIAEALRAAWDRVRRERDTTSATQAPGDGTASADKDAAG